MPHQESTRRVFLQSTGMGLGALVLGCVNRNETPPKASPPQTMPLTDAGSSSWNPTKTDSGTRQLTQDTGSAIRDAGAPSSSLDDAGEATANAEDAGSMGPNTVDAGQEPIIECHQTGADIEGPFYRPNVPIRNELDLYGDAGTRLALSGRVLDLSCNPIPNAVVDIWHAAPTAVAVQDLQVSDAVDYDNTSSEMRYRGQTATDAQGRYSFHTKKPGWYRNAGTFRPMHIHVKVWVGDALKLTTQLYFVGDPYMANDPWASLNRAVTLTPDGPGAEKGTFNFVLGT